MSNLTPQQAVQLSLGRDWRTADRAELRVHTEGGATFALKWDDGAAVYQFADTREHAESWLASLGFGRGRKG